MRGLGSLGLASVVVPAFQEESGIASTLHALDQMCLRLDHWSWEIIVVDDGSRDATYALAKETAHKISTPTRILRHVKNLGLGGALRTGIGASQGQLVITADCDLSYSVETIEELVATYERTHMEVVIASPYMPGGSTVSVPASLEFRSRMANVWLHAASLDDIHTLTGMVRAYNGPFIRSMSLKAVDVDINVEIIYKAQVLRAGIIEVPAVLNWSNLEARQSRSQLTSRRSRWNTYKQLVNGYLWRPFWFPLGASIGLGAVLLLLAILGHVNWSAVAIICGVSSIVLVFVSLMALQSKRYFEELYTLGTGLRTVVGAPDVGARVLPEESVQDLDDHSANTEQGRHLSR